MRKNEDEPSSLHLHDVVRLFFLFMCVRVVAFLCVFVCVGGGRGAGEAEGEMECGAQNSNTKRPI